MTEKSRVMATIESALVDLEAVCNGHGKVEL